MNQEKQNQLDQTETEIRAECNALAEMLIAKNRAYGDSALNPQRIFSRTDPLEQIKVRIDDKLSRLANMTGDVDAMGEDVANDLLGYLILLAIAKKRRDAIRNHEVEEGEQFLTPEKREEGPIDADTMRKPQIRTSRRI